MSDTLAKWPSGTMLSSVDRTGEVQNTPTFSSIKESERGWGGDGCVCVGEKVC